MLDAARDVPKYAIRTTNAGLSYGSRGQGRPVVLVHGWCLNRALWTYHEAHLFPGHRVLTPDLPGFGGSAGLDGPYTLERYADALQDFLEELDLGDAVIVGFAFGAAVAMAVAARGEPRIGGLVLIGVPSAAHAAYDRMPRAMRRDWPEFARRSAVAICKQPQSDATLAWLAGMFGSTPLPVALATVELLGGFEPATLAPEISVPALFVHGEQDDVVPVSVSRDSAQLMPRASVEVVADCGHLVVLDQKERFHVLVDDFLGANHR